MADINRSDVMNTLRRIHFHTHQWHWFHHFFANLFHIQTKMSKRLWLAYFVASRTSIWYHSTIGVCVTSSYIHAQTADICWWGFCRPMDNNHPSSTGIGRRLDVKERKDTRAAGCPEAMQSWQCGSGCYTHPLSINLQGKLQWVSIAFLLYLLTSRQFLSFLLTNGGSESW